MELEAFPRAVEIAVEEEKVTNERTGWRKKLANVGGTLLGSVQDILEDLPPLAKGTLKVVREAIDLFRGD